MTSVSFHDSVMWFRNNRCVSDQYSFSTLYDHYCVWLLVILKTYISKRLWAGVYFFGIIESRYWICRLFLWITQYSFGDLALLLSYLLFPLTLHSQTLWTTNFKSVCYSLTNLFYLLHFEFHDFLFWISGVVPFFLLWRDRQIAEASGPLLWWCVSAGTLVPDLLSIIVVVNSVCTAALARASSLPTFGLLLGLYLIRLTDSISRWWILPYFCLFHN